MPHVGVVLVAVLERLLGFRERAFLFLGFGRYGVQLDGLLGLLYGIVKITLAGAQDLVVIYGVEVKYLKQVVLLGFLLRLI